MSVIFVYISVLACIRWYSGQLKALFQALFQALFKALFKALCKALLKSCRKEMVAEVDEPPRVK